MKKGEDKDKIYTSSSSIGTFESLSRYELFATSSYLSTGSLGS